MLGFEDTGFKTLDFWKLDIVIFQETGLWKTLFWQIFDLNVFKGRHL